MKTADGYEDKMAAGDAHVRESCKQKDEESLGRYEKNAIESKTGRLDTQISSLSSKGRHNYSMRNIMSLLADIQIERD